MLTHSRLICGYLANKKQNKKCFQAVIVSGWSILKINVKEGIPKDKMEIFHEGGGGVSTVEFH